MKGNLLNMKKEIIIVIILVILIVIGHMVTQKYSEDFFDDISESLDEIAEKIYSEDINNEELNKKIDDVQARWKEKYDSLAYFIEHDELEKVQTQLIGVSTNIKVEDYDKGVEELEKCRYILRHIQDKDSLKLVNIF